MREMSSDPRDENQSAKSGASWAGSPAALLSAALRRLAGRGSAVSSAGSRSSPGGSSGVGARSSGSSVHSVSGGFFTVHPIVAAPALVDRYLHPVALIVVLAELIDNAVVIDEA